MTTIQQLPAYPAITHEAPTGTRNTGPAAIPLMGPEAPGSAIPLLGSAAPGSAGSRMGPEAPGYAIPLMGLAAAGTTIALMGPADSGEAHLMCPAG